jgi:hypothetical protein
MPDHSWRSGPPEHHLQDFLTLARAPRLQRESVAVNTLLQEVTSLLEAEAKARSLVLTVQRPSRSPFSS